ncbi:Ddx47 [Symbiodinium sp. KB8]|nr:Ddx47 [Symbiodinium sp. KB8]
MSSKADPKLNNAAGEEKAEEEEEITFKSLGVSPTLCEACDALGWKYPTKIQAEALPLALQGRDIIGLAETGSGKTAAFAIPVIQDLLEKPQRLFAVVLAPTRELAFQINEQFEALGAAIGLKCAVIVGGVDMMTQAVALGRRPHVVIATPGRLVDHLENTKGFNLKTVKYFILDEADRMLSMDFEDAINTVLEAIPRDRRTYLYSATMTSKVVKLQKACLKNPIKVEVSSKYQTVKTLLQQYVFIPFKYKEVYLTYILNEFAGNTGIVFVSACLMAQRLATMLRSLGFEAVSLHGQMSQSKRLGALNKFKSGQRKILIATDVASRGLDIPSVDLVINFDLPTNGKDYVHRVGRTARAGRAGRAISIVTQYDVEMYQRLERLLGKTLEEYPTDRESVLLLLERVMEAQREATIAMREVRLLLPQHSSFHLKYRTKQEEKHQKKKGKKGSKRSMDSMDAASALAEQALGSSDSKRKQLNEIVKKRRRTQK